MSRERLLATGIPRSTVKSWLRRGLLVRLYRGVYAIGHDVLRAEGRLLAAVLACGEGAALSYASAAAWLDLRPSAAMLVDVSVPRDHRPQPGIRVHRPRMLLSGDVIIHKGIATTSPSRTIIDLARVLPLRQLESLVAAAERRDLLDHERLGRVRSRKLGVVLGRGARLTRSADEDRLLDGIRTAGLPEPETNVWLTHGGGEEWQADMLYCDERVIIEIDDDSHQTARAFELDREKDAARQADGYATLRFTRRQIREDLDGRIALLARLVAERGRSGSSV